MFPKPSNELWRWSARVAWVALPFTAGIALADALDGWSRRPAIVAMVFLWAAWLAGAVALFAPRPWGFAILRVVAPSAVVVAALASAPGAIRITGIAVGVLAAVLALGAPIARASANAVAYGDEDRYPLTVPPTIALAPLPVAIAVIGFGLAGGPLLLADGRIVVGIVALVVGLPLAALAANSVFSLSRRWFVLVPAGAVIVDPLTLADPILLPREQLVSLRPGADGAALDLRLGPARGPLTITLREPAPFVRRRGRAGAAVAPTDVVRIGVVDRDRLLEIGPRRRLPVHAATPPPSTTSPS
jgi:hypothetical protein